MPKSPKSDHVTAEESTGIRHTEAGRRSVRAKAMILLLVVGAAGGGYWLWRSQHPTGPGAERLNILLITIDTTRADCLGCYGHPQVQTRNIDALAAGGTLFEQCISAAPMTLPSHSSIMTGKYPYAHGARNNGRVLDDATNVTLAERLQAAGYATAAEVAAYVLDPFWQVSQGFEHYQAPSAPPGALLDVNPVGTYVTEPADVICDRAVSWLKQRDRDRPFFLWVHFFDPHVPWVAPARLVAPMGNSAIAGYLAEIGFVDEQIGRLAGALRTQDVFERTLLVVATDHGEGLGDHQEVTHGFYIYDATMRVGLIMRCPNVIPANRRIATQVRTVDIAPTILELVGLSPLEQIPGRSLARLLQTVEPPADTPAAYGESLVAFEWEGYAPLRFLRAGGWKYIHAPIPELYALAEDPQELVNRASDEPERVEAMRAELEALVAAVPSQPAAAQQISPEAANKLTALGYVGGYVPAAAVGGASFDISALPDPKTHVHFHHRLSFAVERGIAGDHEGASAELRELAQEEPNNPAALSALAFELHRAGRSAESADVWRRLLELQPKNAHAHQGLGAALARLGETEGAVAELRIAAAAMPDFPKIWADLGALLMSAGKPAEALEPLRRAAQLDPHDATITAELAGALDAAGRPAEAAAALRDGLSRAPHDVALLNNLAWLLATCPVDAVRQPDEAVRLAQTAAQTVGAPDPAALDTLAAALAAAGRYDEAVTAAEQAIGLAQTAGAAEFEAKLRSRVALYRAGQPYRAPVAGPAPD